MNACAGFDTSSASGLLILKVILRKPFSAMFWVLSAVLQIQVFWGCLTAENEGTVFLPKSGSTHTTTDCQVTRILKKTVSESCGKVTAVYAIKGIKLEETHC